MSHAVPTDADAPRLMPAESADVLASAAAAPVTVAPAPPDRVVAYLRSVINAPPAQEPKPESGLLSRLRRKRRSDSAAELGVAPALAVHAPNAKEPPQAEPAPAEPPVPPQAAPAPQPLIQAAPAQPPQAVTPEIPVIAAEPAQEPLAQPLPESSLDAQPREIPIPEGAEPPLALEQPPIAALVETLPSEPAPLPESAAALETVPDQELLQPEAVAPVPEPILEPQPQAAAEPPLMEPLPDPAPDPAPVDAAPRPAILRGEVLPPEAFRPYASDRAGSAREPARVITMQPGARPPASKAKPSA